MLKKMTGKGLKNKSIKEIRGGAWIEIIIKDACEIYCDNHCGTIAGTDALQKNGQDVFQLEE